MGGLFSKDESPPPPTPKPSYQANYSSAYNSSSLHKDSQLPFTSYGHSVGTSANTATRTHATTTSPAVAFASPAVTYARPAPPSTARFVPIGTTTPAARPAAPAPSARPAPPGAPPPAAPVVPPQTSLRLPTAAPAPVPVNTGPAQAATAARIPVTHDIADYVVEKPGTQSAALPLLNSVPTGARCDRHDLRVCQTYNQKKMVCQNYCHRFHVCSWWLSGKCDNSNCDLEHSFDSLHNQILSRPLVTHGFSEDNLRDQLNRNMDFCKRIRSKYEDNLPIICPFFILNRCNRNNCSQIHLKTKYSWEVKDGNWVRLPRALNELVETAYCNPNNGTVQVSLDDASDQRSNDTTHLAKILSPSGSCATIDFDTMTIRSSNVYVVRRLSTPSDIFVHAGPSCRWLWFEEDSNGNMEFLRHGFGEKFYQINLSDSLEKQLQNGETEVKVFRGGIKYDLTNMRKISEYNGHTQRLRRRPAEVVMSEQQKELPTLFRDLWTDVPQDSVYTTVTLSRTSHEFTFVEKMIRTTLLAANIVQIERIQNPYLWKAYQLKKRKLLHSYQGDLSQLREQYLFHGTRHDVLDLIYEGNLDWRLHGSNVGCVYGKGTYFASTASMSDGYATPGHTSKVMLVAMVLVGEACIGDHTMDLPPINPRTNCPYDATVNQAFNPTIFVKYNHDEYYPAYTVHYQP